MFSGRSVGRRRVGVGSGCARTLAILAFTVLLAPEAAPDSAAAVKGFSIPATTTPPFAYCVWYLRDPLKESFLNDLKASPPDLFHLGYQIPFKGALGPTYGHDLFTDDILPPDQIPREIERDKTIIRKMREAGVGRIIPYVYTMAFFGNPDTRTGFFHFFDHWDDYRGYGLGPKPEADPTLWLQSVGPESLDKMPGGVLHYNPCVNNPAWNDYLDLVVRQLAAVGYDGMFFDVNTESCVCPHCQEKFDVYLLRKYGRQGLRNAFSTDDNRVLNLSTIYRDFEEVILRGFKPYLADIWAREKLGETLGVGDAAQAKLEEDWRLLRCYMQDSAAEFPPAGEFPPTDEFSGYLSSRFGATRVGEVAPEKKDAFVQAVLRRYFYQYLTSKELASTLQGRFGSADIRRRCCATPRDLLLWVETQRFWCQSMASLFARLKQDGRGVFAEQGRKGDFLTVANLGSMATIDGLNKRRVDGIDLPHWAPAADLQMFEEMNQPGILDSGVIVSNIFAFRWAMAAGTRAGTLLYKVADDRAADLAEAEAAAGGGGALIQAALFAPKSRERWKRFYAEHADLWDGGTSSARVAVLFWSDQVFYEFPEHLATARRLVNVLSETQVPFDLVTEENSQDLAQYDVVFAPMLRYLDKAQSERLLQYAQNGGNLVVVEPFGTEDKWARPQADPLAAVCPTATEFRPAGSGKGRVLRLSDSAVPKRASESWRLMEERFNNFAPAREWLDEARRTEVKSGGDLGPSFIHRLEEALGLRMRWCSPETDGAVYLHAYRIPPRQARPERLIVHAVNYHMPIVLQEESDDDKGPDWSPDTRSGESVAAGNLRIEVPLPTNTSVASVAALSPVGETAPVQWSVEGKTLSMTIGRLAIYQAFVVDLKPRSAAPAP